MKELTDGTSRSYDSDTKIRFLAFTLNDELYAVPLPKVREVVAISTITPVPQAPTYFVGIMDLRGIVISIVDLRRKFKLAKDTRGPESGIIILDIDSLMLGVIVDSIESVIAASPDQVQPPPSMETSSPCEYITGVTRKDKKLVLLLDIDKVLSVEEIISIKTSTQKSIAA